MIYFHISLSEHSGNFSLENSLYHILLKMMFCLGDWVALCSRGGGYKDNLKTTTTACLSKVTDDHNFPHVASGALRHFFPRSPNSTKLIKHHLNSFWFH